MKGKKQKEPAGMNPGEIFAALELLEKERNIPRSFMMDKIIQAITTAYKRDHTDVENVIVDVDEEHRDLRMFVQKVVVDEEDYVDPFNEVPLEEAKAMSARYEIGDVINFPVDKMEFGRIAAGNGKQVIIQGLREAERGMVYDEFNSKQHEILTGVVTRIDPRNDAASLRIGTGSESTEALLLAGEQVPGEPLEEGMHIKVYVVDVRRSTRGPQVLISRTHPGLVKRLFELEVPEIFDGIVEVKSIAREAGSRTKMAVWSSDENIDPIGGGLCCLIYTLFSYRFALALITLSLENSSRSFSSRASVINFTVTSKLGMMMFFSALARLWVLRMALASRKALFSTSASTTVSFLTFSKQRNASSRVELVLYRL